MVVAFLFILSTVLLPDGAWWAFLLSLALVFVIAYTSKLGAWFTISRSVIVLPFTLAAFTIIFTLPGEDVFTIDLLRWSFTATDAGLIRFASILIRSWISVQVAILLVATTQFPDLMHALRHLRVPGVLVSIISFMYRYLHVLVDETLRLLRAREARSARMPEIDQDRKQRRRAGGTVFWRAKVAGNMAGQLFIRSFERSERVYQAMVARGYSGTLLTLNPHVLKLDDWLLGSMMVLSLLVIQLVARILMNRITDAADNPRN